MMGEPVEQSADEAFGTKDRGPFIKRQIAGDQGGSEFVMLAEHSEKQRRSHCSMRIDTYAILLTVMATRLLICPSGIGAWPIGGVDYSGDEQYHKRSEILSQAPEVLSLTYSSYNRITKFSLTFLRDKIAVLRLSWCYFVGANLYDLFLQKPKPDPAEKYLGHNY